MDVQLREDEMKLYGGFECESSLVFCSFMLLTVFLYDDVISGLDSSL